VYLVIYHFRDGEGSSLPVMSIVFFKIYNNILRFPYSCNINFCCVTIDLLFICSLIDLNQIPPKSSGGLDLTQYNPTAFKAAPLPIPPVPLGVNLPCAHIEYIRKLIYFNSELMVPVVSTRLLNNTPICSC
jgi:hypothetical protein